MKLLLLAAFVSLQLLASAQENNPPPATPPPRPTYFDHVPQDPNRRYARNADDDFQAFFHREVSPIIQSEVHKAIQEVMNDNGRLGGDEEHDRYGRSVNPFQPPPPPRRPIMTDDIRGGNRRWARDTLLNEHLQQELHRERRDLQIPGYKKPTHRDIIIPNWNPNARTQPWQSIGVRHRRSYDSRSHASRGTSSSSSSHDTGRTHPGYNRRNA